MATIEAAAAKLAVNIQRVTMTSISASWSLVPEAEGYRAFIREENSEYSAIVADAFDGPTVTVEGLNSRIRPYQIKVEALKKTSDGSFEVVASGETQLQHLLTKDEDYNRIARDLNSLNGELKRSRETVEQLRRDNQNTTRAMFLQTTNRITALLTQLYEANYCVTTLTASLQDVRKSAAESAETAKADVQRAETKATDLTQQLATAQSRVDALEIELREAKAAAARELEKERDQSNAQIEGLMAEFAVARRTADSSNAEVTRVSEQLTIAQQEKAKLEELLQQSQNELNEKKAEVVLAAAKQHELTAEVEKLQKQLSATKLHVEQLTKSVDEEREAQEVAARRHAAELDAKLALVQALQAEVGAKSTELAELTAKLSDTSTAAETQSTETTAKIAGLQARVDACNVQIDALRAELAALKDKKLSLESTIRALEDRVADSAHAVEAARFELTQAQSERDAARAEIVNEQRKAQQLQAALDAATQAQSTADRQAATVLNEARDVTRQIEAKLKSEEDKVRENERTIEGLRTRVTELQATVGQRDCRLRQLEQEAEEQRTAMRARETQLQTLTEDLQKRDQAIRTLTTNNTKLTTERDEARELARTARDAKTQSELTAKTRIEDLQLQLRVVGSQLRCQEELDTELIRLKERAEFSESEVARRMEQNEAITAALQSLYEYTVAVTDQALPAGVTNMLAPLLSNVHIRHADGRRSQVNLDTAFQPASGGTAASTTSTAATTASAKPSAPTVILASTTTAKPVTVTTSTSTTTTGAYRDNDMTPEGYIWISTHGGSHVRPTSSSTAATTTSAATTATVGGGGGGGGGGGRGRARGESDLTRSSTSSSTTAGSTTTSTTATGHGPTSSTNPLSSSHIEHGLPAVRTTTTSPLLPPDRDYIYSMLIEMAYPEALALEAAQRNGDLSSAVDYCINNST